MTLQLIGWIVSIVAAFGLGVLVRDEWSRITWDWLVMDDPHNGPSSWWEKFK